MSADPTSAASNAPRMKARRLGLHSQHEPIVIMRTDSHVSRAEGLTARSQVVLTAEERQVYATLFQLEGDLLAPEEVGLSESAWSLLGVAEGDLIGVSHALTLESLSSVRRRIYGERLDARAFSGIVEDVVAGRYTDVHLAAFLTASSALPLDDAETGYLTRAMVEAGDRLAWGAPVVMDKHSVGGLSGNCTSPIVVSIVASFGLTMPKTSSRAITSPAGTADVMETLTVVDLDLPSLRRVVERAGACLAWGGAVQLSPADDVFIRVERVLDIDTEGQLIASVLSKKIAAGSNHLVVDIPVGPTAKVRSEAAARQLSARLAKVAEEFGLKTVCVHGDGGQPIGRGIGPALEALDVLAVLQNETTAPDDLRRRSCVLAAAALELGGVSPAGKGLEAATAALADGRAWRKFQDICEAQGGLKTPPRSQLVAPLAAGRSGRVEHINNRKLSRLAKLAGAPDAPAAGLTLEVRLGDDVAAGEALAMIHADTPGELGYAMDYAAANPDLIEIEV